MVTNESRYELKKHLNTLSGLYFDGVDDYINQSFTETPSQWTFSGFCNHPDDGLAKYLFNYTDSLGSNIRIQVAILGSNKVFVRTMDNTGESIHTFDYVLPTDNWNHIAITCDGLKWQLFIDGFFQEESNLNFPMNLSRIAIGNDKVLIGTNGIISVYNEFTICHNALFSKVLTQSEILEIVRNLGVIPESCGVNTIHYLPLQYNSSKKHQIFDDNTVVTPIVVNQVAHGFSLNNVVVDDGGYRLATFADAEAGLLELRTVVNVIGVDDFEHGTTGTWSAGFIYENDTLLYLQNDGTLSPIQTDYPFAVVVNGGDGQIGFTEELITYSSVAQFNPQKALIDIIAEEYKDIVYGKTWEQLNYLDNHTPSFNYASKDFYDNNINYITYRNGRVYRGITPERDYANVSSTAPFQYNEAVTMLLTFTYRGDGIIFSWGDVGRTIQEAVGGFAIYTTLNRLRLDIQSVQTNSKAICQVPINFKFDKFYKVEFFKSTSSDASNIKCKINDIEYGVEVPINTLNSNIVINPTEITVGNRAEAHTDTAFNGVVHKIEIIKGYRYNTVEGNIAGKIGTYRKLIPDGDFLFDLETDIPNQTKLLTRDGTPFYNFNNIVGDFELSGKLEINSGQPVIQQSLKIKNIASGNTVNQWVDINKTILPTANDDFTLSLDVYIPMGYAAIVGASGKELNPFYIGVANYSVTQPTRTFFDLALVIESTTSAGYLGFRYVKNGANSGNIIIGESSTLAKVAGTLSNFMYTVNGNLAKFYLNGVLIGSKTITDKIDLTTLPFASIGLNSSVVSSSTNINDFSVVSVKLWKRTLNQSEIIQNYNNSNIANPLLYNPYKADGLGLNSQQDLVLHHIFNKDLFYDDGGIIKLKNLADPTGATDATCNGYTTLNNVYENLIDFRELRLSKEIL